MLYKKELFHYFKHILWFTLTLQKLIGFKCIYIITFLMLDIMTCKMYITLLIYLTNDPKKSQISFSNEFCYKRLIRILLDQLF